MRIVIGLVGVLLVGGCGDAPQRIGHGFGEEGASTLEIPEDIQQQQAEHLRGINESLEGIKSIRCSADSSASVAFHDCRASVPIRSSCFA